MSEVWKILAAMKTMHRDIEKIKEKLDEVKYELSERGTPGGFQIVLQANRNEDDAESVTSVQSAPTVSGHDM